MENKQEEQNRQEERLVRILSKDIEGKMSIYSGLTKIKGISWAISNAICKKLDLDKRRKIGSLTEDEVKKIGTLIKDSEIPTYLINKRNDFTSGNDRHLTSSDLELSKEFDIKRLKKIRSYRGLRHSSNLPSRGQRTKSNFRKNRRKGAGIKKKKNEKKT